MPDHENESLLDKVKNAFGMGHDDERSSTTSTDTDAEVLDGGRDDGWAGVPEALNDEPPGTGTDTGTGFGTEYPADEPSGLGRNPGPVGSAQYEDAATPADFAGEDVDEEGRPDVTREEVASSQFGGAYGQDDTPMPTEAAWDRGEADPLPGEASFGTEDDAFRRRDPDEPI